MLHIFLQINFDNLLNVNPHTIKKQTSENAEESRSKRFNKALVYVKFFFLINNWSVK